jgi:ABC-2 type transport system permease protein
LHGEGHALPKAPGPDKPVVFLASGFCWSFFEVADVNVAVSLGVTAVFLAAYLAAVWWIFRTGYRLKS